MWAAVQRYATYPNARDAHLEMMICLEPLAQHQCLLLARDHFAINTGSYAMSYRTSSLLLFCMLCTSGAAMAGHPSQSRQPAAPSYAPHVDSFTKLASSHPQSRCKNFGARELLVDNFDGPTLSSAWQVFLPDAPYRYQSVSAAYLGASSYTFATLGGSRVIRLHNSLNNTQRRGWSSSAAFPADAPIVYEARFNTVIQSSDTAIDELLELWLLDANDPSRHDIVALTAPGFGSDRIFTAGSSITNQGLDTWFEFSNDTWYRMVITGSPTQEVTAAIYNDARTEKLISIGFGHDLSAYPAGFRVGISQSMGFPGSPYPTDVLIDWVRLGEHPQDSTVVIGTCDSQVPNPMLPSGCAISDFIAECGDRARRGYFLLCVARKTTELSMVRVITRQQQHAIQRCAETSATP
jgi:hypothetical protein